MYMKMQDVMFVYRGKMFSQKCKCKVIANLIFVYYLALETRNLQYNMLGPWVDRLIDQSSDGASIILID